MGWARWFFLGDVSQQLDIEEQKAEIQNLKQQLLSKHSADSSTTSDKLEKLQQENDEFKLYLAAIMRLLISKNLATLAEIQSLVTAIDREDGAEDKRFSGSPIPKV